MSTEHAAPETDDEKHLNNGVITVFEQTRATENAEPGDRSLRLGYHPDKIHILDDEKEDFVAVAVPIAHIELHEPIGDDDLDAWLESDAARMALERFFPDLEPEVLTEHGRERVTAAQEVLSE